VINNRVGVFGAEVNPIDDTSSKTPLDSSVANSNILEKSSSFAVQIAAILMTLVVVVALGFLPDEVEISDIISRPDIEFQVALKNIVIAAAPGDDMDDAAAITSSEAVAELVLVLTRYLPRRVLPVISSSIAAFLVGESVAIVSREDTSLPEKGVMQEAPEPFAISSYLEQLSLSPSFWIILRRQVIISLRRIGPVDVVAELVMWLVFAGFTRGYELDATWEETLAFGAVAGATAELYRDAATAVGLAGPKRRKRWQKRWRFVTASRRQRKFPEVAVAGGTEYLRRSIQAGCLFLAYQEIFFPAFEAMPYLTDLVTGSAADPFRDALQLAEAALYPKAPRGE